MRVIVRKERPHPGAQLRFTDIDGHRFTCFVTNTTTGRLADLELRHRRRARCEDRIRNAKDTGLQNWPLHGFAQNQIWLELVAMASELMAWMQILALDEHARRWEPKRLRLFSAADRLVKGGRRLRLRLSQAEPLGDQRVQPGHPHDALRQAGPRQHPAATIHYLDIVMGLSPVIPDEQPHPISRSPADRSQQPSRRTISDLMNQCSRTERARHPISDQLSRVPAGARSFIRTHRPDRGSAHPPAATGPSLPQGDPVALIRSRLGRQSPAAVSVFGLHRRRGERSVISCAQRGAGRLGGLRITAAGLKGKPPENLRVCYCVPFCLWWIWNGLNLTVRQDLLN